MTMGVAGSVVPVRDHPWVANRKLAEPPVEQRRPHRRDGQTGDEPEPWVEGFRDEPLGQDQCQNAQGKDADRVGDRDDEAKPDRVKRRPPLAHEVGGHDGLAVTGRERVSGPPEDSPRERGDQHSEAELGGGLDQPRESVRGPGSAGRLRPGSGTEGGSLDRSDPLGLRPRGGGAR